MLHAETIARSRTSSPRPTARTSVIPRITARYPDATVEDSYAIQGVWRDRKIAAGRRLVGRKIGLTSKAMQQATGITEPDYGVMFDDTVYARPAPRSPSTTSRTCASRSSSPSCSSSPLEGPDCTLDDVLARDRRTSMPALEVLNSHIELEGRTIVDTISDNAAYGGMVLGDVHMRPDEIDLRWVPGVLSRNGEIEETGVAAGVLGPPRDRRRVAREQVPPARRASRGRRDHPGRIVHPPDVGRRAATSVLCDYGPMGTIACRFI